MQCIFQNMIYIGIYTYTVHPYCRSNLIYQPGMGSTLMVQPNCYHYYYFRFSAPPETATRPCRSQAGHPRTFSVLPCSCTSWTVHFPVRGFVIRESYHFPEIGYVLQWKDRGINQLRYKIHTKYAQLSKQLSQTFAFFTKHNGRERCGLKIIATMRKPASTLYIMLSTFHNFVMKRPILDSSWLCQFGKCIHSGISAQ